MFHVHTHNTPPQSYFTSRDVQNLSPASAPLTVGKGKNPSPSPWVCISRSKRWVTAIGIFVATSWDLPCLSKFEIWTLCCGHLWQKAPVWFRVMRNIGYLHLKPRSYFCIEWGFCIMSVLGLLLAEIYTLWFNEKKKKKQERVTEHKWTPSHAIWFNSTVVRHYYVEAFTLLWKPTV